MNKETVFATIAYYQPNYILTDILAIVFLASSPIPDTECARSKYLLGFPWWCSC